MEKGFISLYGEYVLAGTWVLLSASVLAGGAHAAAEGHPGRIGDKPLGRYRIAVLKDDLPGHRPGLADELVAALDDERYEVRLIDGEALCNASALRADRFDMVLLPTAGSLPAASIPVIQTYLAKGGGLLSLGGAAFSRLSWKSGGRWLSEARWRAMLAEQPTQRMLFDFEGEAEDLKRWVRHTNRPESGFVRKLAPGNQGRGLHIVMEDMAGWDGLASPMLQDPFGEAGEITCLYARGAAQTRTLALEWREKDGSRWIAVFPLTDRWQRYALSPGDFKYWQSVPHRGGPGDRFNPREAVQLIIQVAWTHTGPRGGRYEFFVDEIGTSANPHGGFPRSMPAVPRIEGFCPTYKFYELHDVAELRVRGPIGEKAKTLPLAKQMYAHHPRPTGKGIDKGRGWRWIPVLEAWSGGGDWRGAPGSLYVDFSGPTRGSVRGTIGVADADWYRKGPVPALITRMVERMARGIFFEEAGAQFYTVRSRKAVRVGAKIANLSRTDVGELKVRYALWPVGGDRPAMTITKPVAVAAGATETLAHTIDLPQGASEWRLRVELHEHDRVIDAVEHELALFSPKPESRRRFVTARDGDFYLDGKKWYVHGVNYMPSTGIGIEDGAYFEKWLGRRSYDPEFIQRDLERCRAMGLNSVSIFLYHRSMRSNNLIDILRRCERLGLWVNLSIRPGTPMQYDWSAWEAMLRHDRLWEIDTIYAYDIAWEPFFGTEPQRRRYDPQWRAWIEAKYGSLTAAEAVWGLAGPRHEGELSTPTPAQLGTDGEHRKLVADYRRFADELIDEKYGAAAEKVRRVDPNHLISFRMTVTGDPTFDGSQNMPYDFAGVATCMDFLSPEAYGRIGDWPRVRPGMFTVTYGRFCAPDKPVLWAEAGVSAWDRQTMMTEPERLAFQGTFFADIYRMVLQSYSNGIVWWWYPGGFRVGENSDFGIINPDGTDRPATSVIREHAEAVLAKRRIPEPDMLIEIDRDADARGLFGLYENVKGAYWRAVEGGQVPGLRAKRR